MEPLLQEILDESLALSEKLILQMESGRDDMKGCINGEVLDAYDRAAQEAMDIAEKIRKSLMTLQAGQRPGL